MGNSTTRSSSVGNLIEGYVTTVTAAGTTTLTANSVYQQYFTGTTTQIVVLPVASTMILGQSFQFINNSTGLVTVQSSGANSIQVMAAGSQLIVTCILTSGTDATSWAANYTLVTSAGYTSINPTVQKFTSGSGTYNRPSNVAYIKVRMVGGGGGGSGSGTAAGSAGGTGGTSTFGTSLLSCVGGTAGAYSGGGGTGGTASLGTGPIGTAISGTYGQGGFYTSATTTQNAGGSGGSSPFGGAGACSTGSGGTGTTGIAAIANSGSGGGGASNGNQNAAYTGPGGGSGGYIDAIITNPSVTYSYAIGAAGSAGGAGTNGSAGGAGGSGYIEVTEYYFNNPASGVTVTASSTPTIQTFTSGSGTYNRPSNVQYVRIRMVGGGGGGAGNGVSGAAGGTGGTSTFGTSLLTANGGTGGNAGQAAGGTGGTATVTSPAIGTAITGGAGCGSGGGAGLSIAGPSGASSPFGGAGGGGATNNPGLNAVANTGSGGGGSGGLAATTDSSSSGAAGGYIDAIINNPSATYSYAVGSAGSAGTGSPVGGAGGSGYIEVTEYYTALATGGFTGGGANVPTVQKLTSGSSSTYTTPANVLFLAIKMVGAGGGGAGSGNSGAGNGGAGGNTTFGTSLLTANGGAATSSVIVPGAGGAATVSAPAIGTGIQGGGGGAGGNAGTASALDQQQGGIGASSPFGGSGAAGYGGNSSGSAGIAAIANSGSGGGGSGGGTTASTATGAGGSAGGYISAIITNPSATYTYSIGAAGSAGSAGSNGSAGGAGGSGYIEVTEYYANGTVGTATSITGALINSNFPQAWTLWTPTISASSGSITTSSAVARYQQFGKTVFISAAITITTNGTGSGNLQFTLPFTSQSIASFSAVETVNTGSSCSAYIIASGTTVRINTYNNAYPASSGSVILVCGSYETT
jgi:hypothetical protein